MVREEERETARSGFDLDERERFGVGREKKSIRRSHEFLRLVGAAGEVEPFVPTGMIRVESHPESIECARHAADYEQTGGWVVDPQLFESLDGEEESFATVVSGADKKEDAVLAGVADFGAL